MHWYRRLFRRARSERQLDAELRFHLDQQIADSVAAGMAPAEARRRARLEFGGLEQVKEECRDVGAARFVETLIGDLRYAVRQLRRNPGFTAVVVMTLALGIGLNAAVFSFLDAVALRPLAVPDANRVVIVHRGASTSFSYPDYVEYRDRSRAFSALAATFPTEANLDFGGQSDLITAEAVSPNYEAVMRVPLVLGRWFTDEDQPQAVISYHVWVSDLHSDPNVLGKQIRSISSWFTIVGVAPRDFSGIFAPWPTDLWVPLRFWAKQFPNIEQRLRDPANDTVMIFGRLRGSTTRGQAAANLNGVDAQIRNNKSQRPKPLGIAIARGVPDAANRNLLMPMLGLFAAVALLVLLIACANIGNLLLARGAARQRELAVRMALGAGRPRVVRQLVTESSLLATIGAAGALGLCAWTDRLLEQLRPPVGMPVSLRLTEDIRVFGLTMIVAVVTTLLFGLLPAWCSAPRLTSPILKGQTVPQRQYRVRQVSLVAQVAMSLLLLVCAGLFVRSIRRLGAADPGFAIKDRLYAWTFISRPEFTPTSGQQFYSRAVESLRALPGVRSVGLTHFLPLGVGEGSECVSGGHGPRLHATHGTIGPGYLKTMAIPLLDGRDFSPTDAAGDPAVVIVNETLAQRLWPHQSATGRKLMIGCQQASPARVVGVASDSKILSLYEAPQPYFYRPFSQHYTGLANIVVQTSRDPAAMIGTVRRVLLDESESARIFALDTFAHHVEQSYWQTRWATSLLVILGLLSLGLAAVGLQGVMAYWVNLRTREIGLRMALGAQRRDVLTQVVGHGLKLTAIGVAIGLALSLVATRFLGSQLYGIKPSDPLAFAAVSLILAGTAFLACYIPARRATKVDPMVALRYE